MARITTKSRRSRTLSLDRATAGVLNQNRARQVNQQCLLGELYEDSGTVFTDELGRPLVPETVSTNFDRLVGRYEKSRSPDRPRGRGVPSTPQALASAYATTQEAVDLALAGPPLPPIRLHDLRHGAASLTYRATKDLKLVSELLGHSGIQTTADLYTSLFAEVEAAAAEAVAALVPRSYPATPTATQGVREPDVRTMCAPADIPDTKPGDSGSELGL